MNDKQAPGVTQAALRKTALGQEIKLRKKDIIFS